MDKAFTFLWTICRPKYIGDYRKGDHVLLVRKSVFRESLLQCGVVVGVDWEFGDTVRETPLYVVLFEYQHDFYEEPKLMLNPLWPSSWPKLIRGFTTWLRDQIGIPTLYEWHHPDKFR